MHESENGENTILDVLGLFFPYSLCLTSLLEELKLCGLYRSGEGFGASLSNFGLVLYFDFSGSG